MVRNAMSATEFYILQYLWTRETPATFSEIMVHFNETEHKEWKKQTVNTFLSRLSQKGFLNIDKSGKRAIYIPSVTEKKFYHFIPLHSFKPISASQFIRGCTPSLLIAFHN